jgi:hypothetical protein
VRAPRPARSGVRWYIGQPAVAVAGPEPVGGELPCGPVAAFDPVLVHPATAAEAHTARLARRTTRMASGVASIQNARRVGPDRPAGRGLFQPKDRGHPVEQRAATSRTAMRETSFPVEVASRVGV